MASSSTDHRSLTASIETLVKGSLAILRREPVSDNDEQTIDEVVRFNKAAQNPKYYDRVYSAVRVLFEEYSSAIVRGDRKWPVHKGAQIVVLDSQGEPTRVKMNLSRIFRKCESVMKVVAEQTKLGIKVDLPSYDHLLLYVNEVMSFVAMGNHAEPLGHVIHSLKESLGMIAPPVDIASEMTGMFSKFGINLPPQLSSNIGELFQKLTSESTKDGMIDMVKGLEGSKNPSDIISKTLEMIKKPEITNAVAECFGQHATVLTEHVDRVITEARDDDGCPVEEVNEGPSGSEDIDADLE